MPASLARRFTRSISWCESITILLTPAFIAARISISDLLLPCSSILDGSKFAARATANSPAVQTSIPIPEELIHLATSTEINDLEA